MQSFSSSRWLLGLAVFLSLVTIRSASGQGKGEDIHFETADGFKIEGTYWASKAGKKAPVALLLHDFSHKAGGDSHTDGWDLLAKALNDKDYAVLQFDFRGFGKSTTISNPPLFWSQLHNKPPKLTGVVLNPMKLPESVTKGNFTAFYYPALANDVVAAKAFLDRKNDASELNTANMVVIGAGQGASIGALWLASEFHKKQGVPPANFVGVPPPGAIRWSPAFEGKDVRAAIWLTINPSIENVNLPVRQWVMEASSGKTNKVPTAFIYGKEDTKGDNTALGYMREIVPGYVRGKPIKDNPVPLSGDKAVKTNLTGSKLLQKNLDTASWIVTDYLGNDDMQKTLKEEWRERDAAKSNCYWIFPGLVVVQAKNGMELYSLPLIKFGAPN